jgi:ribosomal protein L4
MLVYLQFRKGATQHGPKPRSHEIGLQKQVRRLGLKVALSARVAEGKVWSLSIENRRLYIFRNHMMTSDNQISTDC